MDDGPDTASNIIIMSIMFMAPEPVELIDPVKCHGTMCYVFLRPKEGVLAQKGVVAEDFTRHEFFP